MKTVMLMFDSLNRNFLSSYGCTWTHTPNFQRLADKTITFETSYVCSMPCMPARRDLHTGRPNFLHRSWGPLEPWDDSLPRMLKEAGIPSHMATDHQHYWEEGAGGNYLSRYTTHSMIRGQEGDPCFPDFDPAAPPKGAKYRNADRGDWSTQDRSNRREIESKGIMPIQETFADGLDFMDRHAHLDSWFLQIETFDPHEPFFSLPDYQRLYDQLVEQNKERLWDWPGYSPVTESEDEVTQMRHNYAALLSACDLQVGLALDAMDRLEMWEDTQLIVWTDHGFCLGEHDCWAKCWLPFYEEIARTPFFMWDPRIGKAGERRSSLIQPSIDLAPTLLNTHGLVPTDAMTGKDLMPVLESDTPVREAALFGMFGTQVNITDGRYVYMRAPVASNQPLYEYTHMPAHMKTQFTVEELQMIELADAFPFTKGVTPMKIPGKTMKSTNVHPDRNQTMLFDVQKDPGQEAPIADEAIETTMLKHLDRLMKEADAPAEQWERLGLL